MTDSNPSENAPVDEQVSSPGPVNIPSPAEDPIPDPEHTQNYIEAYHAISEWIRFADAKAAVILTVGGAMAGLLIPTIHKAIANQEEVAHLFPNWQPIVISMFVAYVLFLILSGVFAFLCINPIREKGEHPSLNHCDHFHPAAIAAKYKRDDVKQFVDDCNQGGQINMIREVQAAILVDSHVSNKKYGKVKLSLRMFSASVFFGFVYFVLLQF